MYGFFLSFVLFGTIAMTCDILVVVDIMNCVTMSINKVQYNYIRIAKCDFVFRHKNQIKESFL